jgi:hypothetical protein
VSKTNSLPSLFARTTPNLHLSLCCCILSILFCLFLKKQTKQRRRSLGVDLFVLSLERTKESRNVSLVVSPLCVRDFYECHVISLVMESNVSEKEELL